MRASSSSPARTRSCSAPVRCGARSGRITVSRPRSSVPARRRTARSPATSCSSPPVTSRWVAAPSRTARSTSRTSTTTTRTRCPASPPSRRRTRSPGSNQLAQQIRASGIRKVSGNVVIDPRLFDVDTEQNQETPTWPIIINDNLIDMVATPKAVGQKAGPRLPAQDLRVHGGVERHHRRRGLRHQAVGRPSPHRGTCC